MADAMSQRPDVVRETIDSAKFGVVEKPLSTWERIYNQASVRKTFILVALAVIWEIYARLLDNPLLFPTFTATIEAFYEGIVGGGHQLGDVWFRGLRRFDECQQRSLAIPCGVRQGGGCNGSAASGFGQQLDRASDGGRGFRHQRWRKAVEVCVLQLAGLNHGSDRK